MLLLFFPKENLFYFAENKLVQYKVSLKSELLQEKAFGLALQNLSLAYEGVEVAKISKVNISLFLLSNSIDLKNIELSSLVSNYMPQEIEASHITYSLFSPLHLKSEAKGRFGEVYIDFNLFKRVVHMTLKPSKLMLQRYRNSLHYLKKLKNGEYTYEKDF